MARTSSRYRTLIEPIFLDRYEDGADSFEFARADFAAAAASLGIDLPSNSGDVIYSFRFRAGVPNSVVATQPEGMEWTLELAGAGRYRFRLVRVNRIVPNADLAIVDIPDATPELIKAYRLADEQALLAIVRYNRLIDTFLGLTAYSLQNHLRTTVQGIGQIEIDELYVGLDKRGRHYAIPVQAKGERDRIAAVQTEQDIRFVEDRFPGLRCRAVAAQFTEDRAIALCELAFQDGRTKIVEERHYRLVPEDRIDVRAVRDYRD